MTQYHENTVMPMIAKTIPTTFPKGSCFSHT